MNQNIVLFELDILKLNLQWVNRGAGIWAVNIGGIYDWIDPDLLVHFSAQDFNPVGSVQVGTQIQTKVATLELVTTTNESWYFDNAANTLYCHIVNNDHPELHRMFVGVINGFSYGEVMPVDSLITYQGRIESVPDIGRSRDPLFFGKLSYNSGSVNLINSDGYFDTFAEDNNIYGNPARIRFGASTDSIENYKTIFTGFIENVDISETSAGFTLTDRRKQLTREAAYSCTAKNALDAILELLLQEYGYQYTAAYFDLTQWSFMTTRVPNITIAYDEENKKPVIDIIEEICRSCFGIFDITPEGLFTFDLINPIGFGYNLVYRISKNDQLNPIEITYDPSEVISSVRIGYAYDWASTQSGYTYLIDRSVEDAVFDKYKTYKEQTFDTLLVTESDAQNLATMILGYTKDVHGMTTRQIPISYHGIRVGRPVEVELNRSVNTMIGTKICEVTGISYNLALPSINATVRIV